VNGFLISCDDVLFYRFVFKSKEFFNNQYTAAGDHSSDEHHLNINIQN